MSGGLGGRGGIWSLLFECLGFDWGLFLRIGGCGFGLRFDQGHFDCITIRVDSMHFRALRAFQISPGHHTYTFYALRNCGKTSIKFYVNDCLDVRSDIDVFFWKQFKPCTRLSRKKASL